MRRAERLFQIVLLLRRKRTTTSAELADELGVSQRTVYRDMQDLLASGVPIESEAGVGYRLPKRFDLPPLMFTAEELEALVAGTRIVAAWGDPGLKEAAQALLRKVGVVLPEGLEERLASGHVLVPAFHIPPRAAAFMGDLRRAIREQCKVRLHYARLGERTERTVWPLALTFWGDRWSLAAWCELRDGFRNFRLDRIEALEWTPERFETVAGRSVEDYLAHVNGPAPG